MKALIPSILILLSYVSLAATEWGYSGKASPEHWADLSRDYKKCKSGQRQSPIDLLSAKTQKLSQKISFHYHTSDATIVNNGHTVKFDLNPANEVRIDGTVFKLIQFHWHASSEHTIDGKRFPAELHLVHQSPEGKLAVLSFLVKVGKSSQFDHIFDVIPSIGKQSKAKVKLGDFIPKNKRHFFYSGSLTTPPCTEGVSWVVFSQPLTIPAKQLQKFKSYYSHDFRNIQAPNNRRVWLSDPK